MSKFFRIFAVFSAGIIVPATVFSAPTPTERRAQEVAQQARDAVVANVNGRIITINDIRQEIFRYIPEIRRTAQSDQDYQKKISELISGTTQNLSDAFLLVSAFDDSGAIMPEDYVDERINAKIEQDFGGDRAKYLQALRLRGSNPLEDRRRTLEFIKASSWDEQMIKPALGEISPALVREEYEKNIEQFRSDAAVEYAQIVLFAGASETDEQVETLAQRVLKQLRNGETDFETAAKFFSRDDYRANGGYIGWRPLTDLSEKIVPELEKIKDGEVSDVVALDSPSGKIFVILKRVAFRPAGITPLKDVYAQIESRLRSERIRRLRAEKMAELRDEYYVRHF